MTRGSRATLARLAICLMGKREVNNTADNDALRYIHTHTHEHALETLERSIETAGDVRNGLIVNVTIKRNV